MTTVNEKLNLISITEYQNAAIVSKELLKQPNGRIVVFAFDEGQELSEHTAPFDALVAILEGAATIRIGGTPFDLSQGEAILMPAHIPHAVKANGRFKMMLCMMRGA